MWTVLDSLYGGNLGCDSPQNVFDIASHLWRDTENPRQEASRLHDYDPNASTADGAAIARAFAALRYPTIAITDINQGTLSQTRDALLKLNPDAEALSVCCRSSRALAKPRGSSRETFASVTATVRSDCGNTSDAWDCFHINSADKDREGNHLISARDACARPSTRTSRSAATTRTATRSRRRWTSTTMPAATSAASPSTWSRTANLEGRAGAGAAGGQEKEIDFSIHEMEDGTQTGHSDAVQRMQPIGRAASHNRVHGTTTKLTDVDTLKAQA
ncbi:hypothetical protein QBC33DRAFT_604052 [Phialemonium atrogriseum]|uniref:Uncharacterized protein n=1 Tax=Phialemonium atrogriseum TaxID=1093897 RepID=A0AAJ0BNS4_9PEZI|nr:uncharacterized protein QBC33DRAFT_604052 [Phialemonium atrogriseum]KAK1761694.1 hypothetical protein QBC33DRAFT_604052 [Phialemonium atrogriseum]